MRKLMCFTIGFTVACALGAYAFSPWLLLGIPLGFIYFFVALLLRKRWSFLRIVAVVSLGLSMGFSWFGGYRYFYLAPAAMADGTELSLKAKIIDYGVQTDYGTSVRARFTIDGRSYRAVLYLKESNDLKPGDHVTSTFRLRLTHEGMEGDTYHRGSGIFLLAYAKDEATYQLSDESSWIYFPAILRNGIANRMEELFPEDTAFFAKALFLGDRSDVDYETNTAFKVSGISHIIAVSGLHISILFSVIFLIAARKRLITALIGIPILILFAAITGFTPSVTRACVMQILFILSEVLLKEYDPPTSLSLPVLIMLICNPISVTSVSLQLSVGCMAGIFLFSEKIRCWICGFSFWQTWKGKTPKVRLRNRLASSVSITLSSMFFTAPLVAYYFGSISLIGVVTNILVLWAVSWIFYGIMLVCFVGLFWSQGASLLAWLVSWLIRYVLVVAKTLSSFPLAAVYTKSGFIVAWLVLCYLLVCVFLLTKKRKAFILICSVLISLVTALMLSWLRPLTANSQVTVLDVGQGQSILLQSHGKTFLVDCGGDDREDAADQAAETLLSMGIYRLDGVILTHYDSDHAGGISYLLSRISADSVFLPSATQQEESNQTVLDAAEDAAVLVDRDIQLAWEECSITIFAPLSSSDDNESGLSVLFRGENCDILITGDMGISGENKLLLEKDIPQLTALVVGHHGSSYSTGEGLLVKTRPQYVFISAGQDNPYGHPSKQVLDRLEKYDCFVYRTDQDGTIVFRR